MSLHIVRVVEVKLSVKMSDSQLSDTCASTESSTQVMVTGTATHTCS